MGGGKPKTDEEKVADALVGHEATLQMLRDPHRWTIMPHRSVKGAETYFKTMITPEEYKGVSNMMSAVVRSDGFEMDKERYDRMDGANRGVNGQLNKLLVTTYKPAPNAPRSSVHFDNSSPVPDTTYLQLTVDQMKMLGIPLATQRAVLPTSSGEPQRS